jgi:hypothetical protein
MSEKEREILLRNYEETLPPNLPDPPRYLVELAREKKRLEEIRSDSGTRDSKDTEKHLALTLEAYKKTLAEVDKMHMKAVIELKTLLSKNDKLVKFTSQ